MQKADGSLGARSRLAGTPSRTRSSERLPQRRAAASPYEVVPYPGHPFAQTHPDRLATLATLFGLEPAPPEGCRVLELGCGDAGNLVPMALALPGGRFVGVDAAASDRARSGGRRRARPGERRARGGCDRGARASPESFDYVIAHGVYSWVPRPCATACSRSVAPSWRRVAWHTSATTRCPADALSVALRDMLCFHTARLDDPGERIERARELLRFLIAGWPEGHGFGAIMRRYAERLFERSDETLFHDELADVNEPVYFHEFEAHAARHGLQYLAEADFFEMQTGVLPDEVAGELLAVEDPVRREQYLDFLKGRMFRQTLLCRAELALDRSPRPLALEGLAVSSPARPAGDPYSAAAWRSRGRPAPRSPPTTRSSGALERAGRLAGRRLGSRADRPRAAGRPRGDLRLPSALLRGQPRPAPHGAARPHDLDGERPGASPLARHQARGAARHQSAARQRADRGRPRQAARRAA